MQHPLRCHVLVSFLTVQVLAFIHPNRNMKQNLLCRLFCCRGRNTNGADVPVYEGNEVNQAIPGAIDDTRGAGLHQHTRAVQRINILFDDQWNRVADQFMRQADDDPRADRESSTGRLGSRQLCNEGLYTARESNLESQSGVDTMESRTSLVPARKGRHGNHLRHSHARSNSFLQLFGYYMRRYRIL